MAAVRRISTVHSPFWSPTRVCSEPKPSPRRLGLCTLRTQTPWDQVHGDEGGGEKEASLSRNKIRQKKKKTTQKKSYNSPGKGKVRADTPPSYLDRLVTGSRITRHSFTSPNLQKYSFKPSAKTRGVGGVRRPHSEQETPVRRCAGSDWAQTMGVGRTTLFVCVPPPPQPSRGATRAIWPLSTTAHEAKQSCARPQ